jgi:hypothetical protein
MSKSNVTRIAPRSAAAGPTDLSKTMPGADLPDYFAAE